MFKECTEGNPPERLRRNKCRGVSPGPCHGAREVIPRSTRSTPQESSQTSGRGNWVQTQSFTVTFSKLFQGMDGMKLMARD